MALQESFEKEGNFLFRYRSFLPLLVLVAGIALFIFANINGSLPDWIPYSCVEYCSLIFSLGGLLIRIIAVGHTPANTSGRNTKQQLADELNTTGIYSTLRHPLYLGNFFMWLGAVVLVGNAWFLLTFALAYWIYYERIMYAEEQFLRRKFGQPYLDWADSNPAFIPSFKKYQPSKYPFSWKKILRKEKNGILAIFVLLFIFHNIKYSIENDAFTVDNNWILWATLAALVLYFLVKILKKYTSALNESGR